MFSLKEGQRLVEIARKELDAYFKGQEQEKWDIKGFDKRLGVFVSLHSYPEKELRGCVGFPVAHMPLWKAVKEAAKAAAFEDIRFLSLTKEELDKIIIEISVLTKPELIEKENQEDIVAEIEIGKDGLILEYSGFSGLFLPQVPIEQKWNIRQYLENLCIKAGVSPKTWTNKSCKIYKFQAQIFSEQAPKEKAKEVKLKS